ncbi:RWD domain-containing protein 3 [Dendropsophus ebraccatus]|uniref:RWD domain-containing protein 3 n=1 Tax=Dendropsophus ebraccatus TaxID=150705 RepID=UPI00383230F1
MSGAAQEEVSVLSAIYCDPGQCRILSCSENGMTVMIQTSAPSRAQSQIHLRLVFDLPVTYPSCPPNLSVSSEELTRAQCTALRDRLVEQARERPPEPMIHDLVLWTQQNCESVVGNRVQDEERLLSAVMDEPAWTTLIHIDHMRAKNKYVKTIEKWMSDLGLSGRLMFMGKLILILLQGDRSHIQDYLLLQKTCKVDVDSSGKKCKERMISVLCDMKLPPGQDRFPTFEVAEFSSIDELERTFFQAGLSQLFTEHVRGLC